MTSPQEAHCPHILVKQKSIKACNVQNVSTRRNDKNTTYGNSPLELEMQMQTSNSLSIACLVAFSKTTSKEKTLRHEACDTEIQE